MVGGMDRAGRLAAQKIDDMRRPQAQRGCMRACFDAAQPKARQIESVHASTLDGF